MVENVEAGIEKITREYHRRYTHGAVAAQKTPGPIGFRQGQVDGELMSLRAAIGMLLGGEVPGGTADSLGFKHHRQWMQTPAAAEAECDCQLCATKSVHRP